MENIYNKMRIHTGISYRTWIRLLSALILVYLGITMLLRRKELQRNGFTGIIKQIHKALIQSDQKVPARIFPKKFVHLDLKGAPPSMNYLISLIPLFKKLRINGILMEYEDTFPYTGDLTILRNKNFHYSESEIKKFLSLLHDNNIEVVPLVQTFGHLEFLLKHSAFKDIREIMKYPQAVCPSNPKSRQIVEQLIDQIMAAHPGIKSIHIGSDEVYDLGKCLKCQDAMKTNNWNRGDLFLDHVTHVVNYCVKKHNLKPMIWDDHFRALSDEQLGKIDIKEHIHLVVWNYKKNVLKFISLSVMQKYSRHFPHIWAASAFKGAQRANTVFHSLQQRVLNHVSWYGILQNRIMDMEGIIMTGWQRYDHLSVLCELLPMGIPSLVINALFLDSGKLDQGLLNDSSVILNCDQLIATEDRLEINEEDLPVCQFPGGKIFEHIALLKRFQNQYENFLNNSYFKGWLQYPQENWGYCSPFKIESVVRYAKLGLYNFASLAENLNLSLSEYFPSSDTNEFIHSYLTPIRKEYVRIIEMAEKCIHYFSDS